MKSKTNIKNVAITLALVALIAGGIYNLINIPGYFIAAENAQLEALNVVYNNVFIRGNAVGGLTPEQANTMADKLINGDYSADKKLNFRLAQGDYQTSFTYEQLGMGFDVAKAVSQAYNYGRDEKGKIKRGAVAEMDVGAKYIDAETTYSLEPIKNCLATIEDEVNAQLAEVGLTMDLERTAEQAQDMLMINEYDALIYIATK